MKSLLIIINTILFLVVLSGCGDYDTPKTAKKREVIATETGLSSIFYNLEDPQCKDGLLQDMSQMEVWLYNQEDVVPQLVDLEGTHPDGLRNEVIQETFTSQDMNIERSLFGAASSIEVEGKKRIRICKNGYNRKSLENVALATVYGVNESYRIFKKQAKLLGLTKPIAKLDVIVQPHAYQVARFAAAPSRTTLTDNAMWSMSTTLARPIIVVLPHSEETSQYLKVAYWEQKMVIGHEFGHHIFNYLITLNPNFEQITLPQSSNFWHNGNILSAVNEAFADLSVYLTFLETEPIPNQLHFNFGRTTATQNRSLISPSMILVHKDGRQETIPKILDKTLLRRFFHATPRETFFFEEVHSLGNVIAYIAWRVLSEKFAGAPQYNDRRTLIYRWVMQISPLLNKKSFFSSKQLLGEILLLLLEACQEFEP